MDEATKQRKFELAYMVAKENLSFKKMKPLWDIEEKHGVEIGASYQNDYDCASFVEAIAADLQGKLKEKMSNTKFFSLLLDSSTDCSNAEEELFLALFFDPYSTAEEGTVHVKDTFFAVCHLARGTRESLYGCVKKSLTYVGVEWRSKMVGLGCDGTNANIGSDSGLKSYLLKDIPWLVVSWCFAHWLELSIKDALKDTYFKETDQLLLQIYYVYEKSPKSAMN